MKLNNRPVVVSGASITNDSTWPTWATWVKHRYGLTNITNVSVKGIGNELILLKAIHAAKQLINPVIVVQLTNVDKWDWYVDNPKLITKINQEKHPITRLSNSDANGFWSTGSHFPLWKEYYKNNYYSIEYQTYKTLQQLQWFQMLCNKQQWQYLVLFDSPILSVTEQQLNIGQLTIDECLAMTLVNNSLSQSIFESTMFDNIYLPGLIGYACQNNLLWHTDKFKGHPGSLVHYYFTKDIISTDLDKILTPVVDFESFLDEATRFQMLVSEDV
jgi:hypothetical protein